MVYIFRKFYFGVWVSGIVLDGDFVGVLVVLLMIFFGILLLGKLDISLVFFEVRYCEFIFFLYLFSWYMFLADGLIWIERYFF